MVLLQHPVESERREPKQVAPAVLTVLGYIVLGISLIALAWLAAAIVLDWH